MIAKKSSNVKLLKYSLKIIRIINKNKSDYLILPSTLISVKEDKIEGKSIFNI